MEHAGATVVAAVGLLSDVADCDLFEPMNAPRPPRVGEAIRRKQMQLVLRRQNRNKWALVESIVAFDEIWYDSYAFSRVGMTAIQRERLTALEHHGLVAKSWPLEAYRETARKLSDWTRFLELHGLEGVSRAVSKDPTLPYSTINDAYDDNEDKYYHDGLFAEERSRWAFADTSQTFERAFFYAELCRELGVGMLPRAYCLDASSTQQSMLGDFARSYGHCIHHYYIHKRLQPFDTLMRPAEIRAAYPPLAEKIARVSLESGRTPTDIAAEMRISSHARTYRRYLANLQHELAAGSSGSDVSKLLGDLEALVNQWVTEREPKAGIAYQRRTLSANLLPIAASLAGFLVTRNFDSAISVGAAAQMILPFLPKDVTVRDPILWGAPRYIEFVADWYR